jgi:hypothetical protein
MFQTELDRSQQLLTISWAGHATVEEARVCLENLQSLLTDIEPGFRLFADLSRLLSMPTAAAPYIGQIMESCSEKGWNWWSDCSRRNPARISASPS